MESWKIRKNQRAARQPGAAGIAAIVAAVDLASGHQIILPESLLEICAEDCQPLRAESTQDLDGRDHHDFRPPLYSLLPRVVVGKIEREVERVETLQELVAVAAGE